MGFVTIFYPMGLFKKRKARIVETLSINLGNEIEKHDTEIANYQRMKKNIHKFINAYKEQLTRSAYIHGDSVTLHLKEDYYSVYPDGFFALADKLGLNIEPICSSSWSSANERSISVRAKRS